MDDLTPDPGQLGERGISPRGLWLVGLQEAASLAVLVINLLTADNAAVAQAIGSIHGLLYVIGIATGLEQPTPHSQQGPRPHTRRRHPARGPSPHLSLNRKDTP